MKTKAGRAVYPAVKRLVGQAVTDYLRNLQETDPGSVRPSNRALAKLLGLSPGAFSSFQTGTRSPSPDSIRRLGGLYEFDHELRTSFESGLATAARQPPSNDLERGVLLESLAAGGVLDVSTMNYEPISGAKDRFFDYVLDRFWSLTGIKIRPKARTGVALQETLSRSQASVLVSYFSTLDRSLRMRFWPLPVRVSLGAVCLSKFQAKADAIAKIISLPKDEKPQGPDLKLILLKGEVGEIHQRHTLQGIATETVDSLSPQEFVDALRGQRQPRNSPASPDRSRSEASLVPVILVDELTSIKCLQLLGDDGIPILPLSGRATTQSDPLRRELPQYFVSFACPREQEELSGFLNDAWAQFLRTEVETTGRAYFNLYKQLIGLVTGVARHYVSRSNGAGPDSPQDLEAQKFRKARAWALYTLQLDRASLNAFPPTDPWRPILERARKLVQDDIGNNGEQIKLQIDYSLSCTINRDAHKALVSLREAFDIDLAREALDTTYGKILTPEALQHAIRRALLGETEPMPVVVRFEKAVTAPRVKNVIVPLLKELMSMYENRKEPDAADGIDKLLKNWPGKFGTAHSGVLLAYPEHGSAVKAEALESAGGDGAAEHCSGCSCLGWISEGMFAEYCELRYLFVSSRLRGQHVGERIVQKAKETVIAEGGKGLVAYILPSVLEGILFFVRQGFKFESRPEQDAPAGRMVLYWKRQFDEQSAP